MRNSCSCWLVSVSFSWVLSWLSEATISEGELCNMNKIKVRIETDSENGHTYNINIRTNQICEIEYSTVNKKREGELTT